MNVADVADDSLEALIVDGLQRFGNKSAQLGRWVLTGVPANMSLDHPFNRVDDDEAVDALMAALLDADPMIEWRLGKLLDASTYVTTTSPAAPLAMLWDLRGEWPSDDRIEAMLAGAGLHEIELVRHVLPEDWDHHSLSDMRRRPLFSRVVADNPDLVMAELYAKPNFIRLRARALADVSADTLNSLAAAIAELATDTSKLRREAGAFLAAQVDYDTIAAEFRRLVDHGSARVRAEAIRAWAERADGDIGDGKIGDDRLGEVLEYCRARCGEDPAGGVQRALEELVARTREAGPAVEWPTVDDREPTGEERAAFVALFDSGRLAEPVPADLIEAAWEYVRTGRTDPDKIADSFRQRFQWVDDELAAFTPLHLLRLVRVVRWDWASSVNWPRLLGRHYLRTGHPTPLEIQATAESVGFDRSHAMRLSPITQRWRRDDLSEWATALLAELTSVVSTVDWVDELDKFYLAMSTLAELPTELRHILEAQAVGSRKTNRPLARMVLNEFPGAATTAIGFLSSKKYHERAEAANWLAELGATEAVADLHAAAGNEAHDLALGAQLAALERLGASIDGYLDPEAMLARAAMDLEKPPPAVGARLSLDSLPELRWGDRSPVDPTLTEWMVVQAIRSKSVAPSPIVRRLFARMDPATTSDFAGALLAAWIANDLEPYGLAEATARAAVDVQHARTYRQHTDLDDDELLALMLQPYLDNPAGSATASKGVLSLVAAGGDHTVVRPAASYIRKWQGRRASQSKSLIEMLAWVDDPAAIQFVVSVANRFQAAGIRNEAIRQVDLLAERNGWTPDDLSYRAVPSGGFDADGRLILDYGDRRFEARLADDVSIELTTADGKIITALPPPRADENDAQVELARQQLRDAKEQVKSAAKDQPMRLRDAMITQKRFAADDFRRYILGHPVMRRLATRVVWAAVSGQERTLFRPLSDGTLLDVRSDEIDIGSAGSVAVAHEAIDGREAGLAWRAHLAEYRLTGLFEQFGRPSMPTLTEEQTELVDVRGAVIDDRVLRSISGTIGFEFGSSTHGEWIDHVDRRIGDTDLRARISVRGLAPVVSGDEVELGSLTFTLWDDDDPIRLAEIPPVLLVETIADVEHIAAAGGGIDPPSEGAG